MATPTSAIRAVEAAIRTLVIADTTFNTRCPGGLASHEDDVQEYPFVLFDKSSEMPWDTLGGATTGLGRAVMLRMHIFSRYKGDVEALEILERLVELLNFGTLSVSDYTTVIVEYFSSKVLIEDRKKLETRHIPVEFLVRLHQ